MSQSLVTRFLSSFCRVYSRNIQSSEMKYLSYYLEELVRTRNARVDDFNSSEMKEVFVILGRVFPVNVHAIVLWLCIDGRLLSTNLFGLPIGSFRTPAADTDGLLDVAGKGVQLFDRSLFERIKLCIDAYGVCILIEDSHTGCAARGGERKNVLGYDSSDGGLLFDVERKVLLTGAIIRLLEEEYGVEEWKKKVLILPVSFDVKSGLLRMGLEKESVLSAIGEDGYTASCMQRLSDEGKIFCTQSLIEEVSLRELFEENIVAIDFGNDYAKSMLDFWQRFERIMEKALPRVRSKIVEVFPYLKEGEGKLELDIRAILLLANAFKAYLLAVSHDGKNPTAEHEEMGIVGTGNERGPHGSATAFPINYPASPQKFSSDVLLAVGIVRGNRLLGRIPERERSFVEGIFGGDRKAFARLPVPILLPERIQEGDKDIPLAVATMLSNVDWSEVEWNQVSPNEFSKFVQDKVPGISDSIVHSLETLRSYVLQLYHPDTSPLAPFLRSGGAMLIPALRTSKGAFLAFLPFCMREYPEKYLDSIGKM